MKKKFTLEFDIPVLRETKRKVKKGEIKTIPVQYDVEGMMHYIRRAMSSKTQQDLLDEYAKFWLYKQVGIKLYPIVEKDPSPEKS